MKEITEKDIWLLNNHNLFSKGLSDALNKIKVIDEYFYYSLPATYPLDASYIMSNTYGLVNCEYNCWLDNDIVNELKNAGFEMFKYLGFQDEFTLLFQEIKINNKE